MDRGIRQRLEAKEEALSPYAARSVQSRGRLRDEPPCSMRTSFQRDRDRIIYAKAFRRLKHKTQVFIAPLGDHYVTRLTHTLEVAQIARSISRALSLNEDLTEAIALGHDLGHTPFGHVGEQMLNQLYPGGFHHNEQSLRVVDILEKDGQGLNLTWEVRDGILHHSKGGVDVLGAGWIDVATLEGQVCKIADVVAYINHDTSDAIRAGLIQETDLPEDCVSALGRSPRERINTMVLDIVDSSWAITGLEPASGTPAITMRPQVRQVAENLRQFLFQRVYNVEAAEARQARDTIALLYDHFTADAKHLPHEFLARGEGVERGAVDYIAGMTDQFAQRVAESVADRGR